MAAPWAADMETRLFLAQGDRKLRCSSRSSSSAPSPIWQGGVAGTDTWARDAHVGALSVGGLPAIGVVPKAPKPDDEKALALGLHVVAPDATVIRVGFYVSPDVVPQGRGCARLARGMAETLAAGPRRLDLKGGTRRVEDGIVLDPPPEVALVPQQGPDFTVYRFLPQSYLSMRSRVDSTPVV